MEFLAQYADRPGVVRGGLGCQARQLVEGLGDALPAALRRPLRRDCKVLFLIHAFKVYVQKGQVFLPARASPSDGIIVGRLFGDGLAATR